MDSATQHAPSFTGNCRCTAMGILPHSDVERALELSLSLDIPFWPQLPKLNYYEDMYVQASEHFPGVIVDEANARLIFNTEKFMEELPAYVESCGDPEFFAISGKYSAVLDRFLQEDFSRFYAIRGQLIGPISFGLKLTDENSKPIIYNAEIRTLLYDFLARKVAWQFNRLREKNPRAFVWVDDPGLEFLFASLSGYTEVHAKADMLPFLSQLPGLRGVHLCGRPDWDFLLGLPLDILSLDAFSCGAVFSKYERAGEFLRRGGIISWGIVPTHVDLLSGQTVPKLRETLLILWERMSAWGLKMDEIAAKALLAPATCCLINPDKTASVERAFETLRELSELMKEEFRIPNAAAV